MNLIELQPLPPHLLVDIKYATSDNFMNEVLYPVSGCYLEKDVYQALQKVLEALRKMELGIKVWDGFRPLSVQKKMWDTIQDERYVSNPYKEGGRHTRGTAIDLTLVDLEGNELEMPTPFDSFDEKAHSYYSELPEIVLKNRKVLKEVMESHGFLQLPTEWWHFDWKGWQNYPVQDVNFEELLENQAMDFFP